MAHPGAGHVAHSPAGLMQAQAQVDVFAEPEFRGESAAHGRLADHQCRARDVCQRGQRRDRCLAPAHPQRRPDVLVPVEAVWMTLGYANYPGRRQRQGGIGELCQQRAQPARLGQHVGVAEGDISGPRLAQPGVARRGGPLVASMNEQRGAVQAGHRGHRGAVHGPVVDDQRRNTRCLRVGAQGSQQLVQPVRPIPYRDHDRDVADGPSRGARVHDADIHEPPGHCRCRRVRHGEPAGSENSRRRLAKPQQPGGRAAEHQPAVTGAVHVAGELDGKSVRQPGIPGSRQFGKRAGSGRVWSPHPVNPPSACSTDPVMALASGEQAHATTDATSSGSSSRRTSWWSASCSASATW